MKTIKLDEIIVDYTFNPRQNGLDWISVEEYSQAVDGLPPMHVFDGRHWTRHPAGKGLYLVASFHRGA